MRKKSSFTDLIGRYLPLNFKTWRRASATALAPFEPALLAVRENLWTKIAAVLALILTLASLGTALGALFTLLSALLVLYFILTQVAGLEFGDVVTVR